MTSVTAEEFFSVEPSKFEDGMNVSAASFFDGGEVGSFTPKNESEKLSAATRFSFDIEKRVEMSKEIIEAVQAGEQSTAEGVLQVAGKVGAGSIMDFLGELVVSGGRGLSAITPDIIEQPLKNGAVSAGHLFLNTDIGQKGLNAARQGVDAYKQFRAENPRAARNIEAVVDIALLLVPAKGKPKTGSPPTAIGRAGEKLSGAAQQQQTNMKKAFIDDLILPKQTQSVLTEQVGRTAEQGALRSKKVALSPQQEAIARTIDNVADVSPKKTLQGNYSAISKELGAEAERLKAALAKNDVPISRKEVLDAGKVVRDRLKKNPTIVGDAEKTAAKILTKMDDLVKSNKPTASGLLQARKELDNWMRRQKGDNIFDPAQQNAMSVALREVRESANDMIAKKTPDIGVKESLRKQSNMYRALDNIGPKAAAEANNVALRLWQNMTRILPFRGEFNQSLALIIGIDGLGAAATFAPFFQKIAFTGLATYVAGKAATSPQLKKAAALLLKGADKAIRTTKDQAFISQLRLDRALLVEILKEEQK